MTAKSYSDVVVVSFVVPFIQNVGDAFIFLVKQTSLRQARIVAHIFEDHGIKPSD